MIVLGTDSGLASFGWALVAWEPQRCSLLDCGTIRTKAEWSTQERCAEIRFQLRERAQLGEVEVMVLENQERAWAGALERGTTNAKALLARVGEGVARSVADEHLIAVLELEPQEIRSALGVFSNATKEEVKLAAARRVGDIKGSNHATDAVAAAVAGGARWSVLRRIWQARGAARK